MNTPIDNYVKSYNGNAPRDGITRDIAFNRHSFGEDQPQNPDQYSIHVGLDDIEVELVQNFDDSTLQRIFTYAINATRGISPRNPPDEVDWEEMMKGGLQTALEDIRIAFAVYGASRTATHQIVRSRRAAFHQQSQRAHYYGDCPSVRMPESFIGKKQRNPDDPEDGYDYEIAFAYQTLAAHAAWFYRLACDADISYQDARFGLLEGTSNFILCEYSLAEFIAVYSYRACSMFQWEIQHIVKLMKKALVEAHPWLEPHIKISCERTKGALDLDTHTTLDGPDEQFAHHCTFQGWEEVDGQCSLPWARETNRSFRSEHHRIEKS